MNFGMKAQNRSQAGSLMNHLHNRLIFDLVNKNQIPRKKLLKVVKLIQKFGWKCSKVWKI